MIVKKQLNIFHGLFCHRTLRTGLLALGGAAIMANKIEKNIESCKHHRIDPVTGEESYFFPMKLFQVKPGANDSWEEVETLEHIAFADRKSAEEQGLEICRSRLGNEVFEAVMVPCKDHVHDRLGNEVYIDTPPEKQREIYHAYISSFLREQDIEKRDGRCMIPDGKGGLKRCPLRMKNPDYAPGNGEPKERMVKCEGCVYNEFRKARDCGDTSTPEDENAGGNTASREIPALHACFQADLYLRNAAELADFIDSKNKKLTLITRLLIEENNPTDIAEMLGLPKTTVYSRREKIRELTRKFMPTAVWSL